MFFGAPHPRFRIYTTPESYTSILPALLSNSHDTAPIDELEKEISRRAGTTYAVAMPTARTGIYLTLCSLIRPGQRVLLSPLTIVDVVNMVICAGGIPHFVDVEKNTCNVDPEDIERNINKNTGAVLITHLHGLSCDVDRIRMICERMGVPLIEDAAQSFSTTWNGRWTGSFGRAGIFSFGMYKVVNTFYGGMVVTSDESLYRDLKRRISALPYIERGMLMDKVIFALITDISTLPAPFSIFTYWFFRYAYLNNVDAILNLVTVDRYPRRSDRIRRELMCRLRPEQASLILKQLDRVPANNLVRIRNAQRYDEGLRHLPQLTLPPLRTDGSHIYTYYAVRFPDRQAFMRYAFERHRDLVLSHYHNCASLKIFDTFYQPCPNAESTANELVYLPTYPRYPVDQIDENIRVIQDFFK